jgi:hypothetical protein
VRTRILSLKLEELLLLFSIICLIELRDILSRLVVVGLTLLGGKRLLTLAYNKEQAVLAMPEEVFGLTFDGRSYCPG